MNTDIVLILFKESRYKHQKKNMLRRGHLVGAIFLLLQLGNYDKIWIFTWMFVFPKTSLVVIR